MCLMFTSWSVLFRSWQVILLILKVFMAGSFWHRRRGSGEKLWRWGRLISEVFVEVFDCLGLLQIFLPVKVRSAAPQLMDSNSIMLSPTNFKTRKRHTEETKAQSSIHDCTADQEMSCWAMPHGVSSYKPEPDLCATLCNPTQHRAHLPPWRKPVQLVQRHKCRHGQVSEGY